MADSCSALVEERSDLVEKWSTTEDDYYGRLKNVDMELLRDGTPVGHSEMVCDVHGSWEFLPFDDNSVDEILSRQVFEHLSLREAKGALLEARRVLADDGLLRLDVPDHEASMEQYRETGDAFFKRHLFGSRKNTASYHCIGWTRQSLAAFCEEYGLAFAGEEENIHFYPAFCLKFRKRPCLKLDANLEPENHDIPPYQWCQSGTPLLVPDDCSVLEVGPGRYPWPRANHYCDVIPDFMHDLKNTTVANVTELPFRDNQFDYVFSSHILEHIEDPAKACAELSRVAKSGCIVCPSWFVDAIFCLHEKEHQWAIHIVGDTIVFVEVTQEWRERIYDVDVSKAMHQIWRLQKKRYEPEGSVMRQWWRKTEPFADAILHWDGEIKCQVIRQESE